MISDDELNALLAPSNQPYTGNPINPDPMSRELPLLGQINPVVDREIEAAHGRFLNGFGADDMQDLDKPTSDHADVVDMEDQDDVVGSGIFDPFRRPPTVNAQMGVFEARYSIPGYHAREVPFMVNHEITDISNGAEVVGIPSGGLNYVEHGKAMPYLDGTNEYEPYAKAGSTGGKGWSADNTLAPGERLMHDPEFHGGTVSRSRGGMPIPFNEDPRVAAKRRPFHAPGHLPREPMFETREINSAPHQQRVAESPALARVPQTPTVYPVIPQIPAASREAGMSRPAAPYTNVNRAATSYRVMAPSPSISNAALTMSAKAQTSQRLPSPRQMSGFGQEDSDGPGVGTYVALAGAGLLAGIAIRLLIPRKGT